MPANVYKLMKRNKNVKKKTFIVINQDQIQINRKVIQNDCCEC